MTKFTFIDHGSNTATSGMTVAEVAAELLGYDGCEWEIRARYISGCAHFDSLEAAKAYQAEMAESVGEDDAGEAGDLAQARADAMAEYEPKIDGYYLWTRQQVANKPWTRTIIFSLADTAGEAEAEILAEVVACGHWESDNRSVMTDEAYAKMLAEDAAEEGE